MGGSSRGEGRSGLLEIELGAGPRARTRARRRAAASVAAVAALGVGSVAFLVVPLLGAEGDVRARPAQLAPPVAPTAPFGSDVGDDDPLPAERRSSRALPRTGTEPAALQQAVVAVGTDLVAPTSADPVPPVSLTGPTGPTPTGGTADPVAPTDPTDPAPRPTEPGTGRLSGLLSPAEQLVLAAVGAAAPGLVPLADDVFAATGGLLDAVEEGLPVDQPVRQPVRQGASRR
jgi:hypothetical protein